MRDVTHRNSRNTNYLSWIKIFGKSSVQIGSWLIKPVVRAQVWRITLSNDENGWKIAKVTCNAAHYTRKCIFNFYGILCMIEGEKERVIFPFNCSICSFVNADQIVTFSFRTYLRFVVLIDSHICHACCIISYAGRKIWYRISAFGLTRIQINRLIGSVLFNFKFMYVKKNILGSWQFLITREIKSTYRITNNFSLSFST